MRSRFLLLAVVTLALVALMGGVAYADTAADNAECLTCHGPAVGGSSLEADFSVGDVDYAACNTCHYKYKHFEHPGVPTPCTNCHLGAQVGAPYYYSDTPTPYGYFSDVNYASKTPEQLHAIHANGNWVAGYFRPALGCRNCHASASCSTCHKDVVSHGDHALPDYSALTYTVATGTAVQSAASTCVNEACHSLARVSTTEFIPGCSTCHFTFAEHYDEIAHTSATLVGCSGAGCHSTPDLLAVHTQRNAEFGCGGCHDSIRADVQNAIADGLTGCSDCHGSISALTGHRDAHWPSPPLADDDGSPNYSYYTGSAGTAPTGDCAGCHTSNLVDEHLGLYLGGWVTFPRFDSTGATLTCGTCHDQPAGSTVQNAIAGSLSACESCHQVHGPIPAAHESAFVDSPSIPCADCHDADVSAEHVGITSSAGLTGCDVCHELYAGEFGATVQSAIAVTNDTRCSACHTAYHTDTTVHEATSVDSLACGACHATGQTLIDVTAIHPTCITCHDNDRIGEISDHTAECSSCHAAEGDDYHRNLAVHVAPASGCSVTGCHHSNPDVTVIHEDGCGTCHNGSALPATTACANCHVTVVEDYHYDFDTDHTPVDAYSAGCAGCHDTTDVRALHVTAGCEQCHFISGCTDCHATHMGGVGLAKSTGCETCHATEGTDYHSAMDTSHTFAGMGALCLDCHPSTLPEAHENYLSRYPGYASTCDLCHENADSDRIDWSTASADCSTCHEIHGDIVVVHTTVASQACVACHESADVRTLHGASPEASCDVCHNAPEGRIDWANPSIECTYCHGALSPADPNHYPVAAHAATTETGCVQCHSADMKAEHFKTTVAVSCVACHELKVDAFTAPWDKTCTACHPTKHTNQAIAHKSANTTCSGTGCHAVTDVSVLHGTNCAACHAPGVAASVNCEQCHSGTNPHHVTIPLKMTTISGWRTVCGSCHGRTHSMVTCTKCHTATSLHGEEDHVDANSRCSGCHKVATADVAKNCLSCHADVQSESDDDRWGGWGR